MKKNDFYLTSLELVKERIENRLKETSHTPIENETDSVFDWMLSQLHWKMEGTHPVTKSCRIEFYGTTNGNKPGLRYGYLAEYYPNYINNNQYINFHFFKIQSDLVFIFFMKKIN